MSNFENAQVAGLWLPHINLSTMEKPISQQTVINETTPVASLTVTEVTTTQGVAGSFTDQEPATLTGNMQPIIAASVDSNPRTGHYEAFFEEFVKLGDYTWASTTLQGSSLFSIDPIGLLLTNASMARKTANYFRATWDTVEVKILVNAAKTQYGHAVVGAIPQGTEIYGDGEYTFTSGTYGPLYNDVLPTIWQMHAGIHADIAPSTSAPVVLSLPWVSPLDALVLSTIGTSGAFGGGLQTQWRLQCDVVAPLNNSTNTTAVANATVSVYARFRGLKLSAPLSYQSGSGPAQGTVGKIAGAVKGVAGALKAAPLVGQLAGTVELVSGAVGAVADHFGFSRLPSNQPPTVATLSPLPGMPYADGVDTGTSLSLLRDNKVSIDPAIGGDSRNDVMAFSDLFARKTLIGTVAWTTSQAVGTNILTKYVAPSKARAIFGVYSYAAPFAYVGTQFESWRGPIYYEIRVYASAQHSGRLQIAYYPYAVGANPTPDPTNVSYNDIMDINGESCFCYKIGWCQAAPFKHTGTSAYYNTFNADAESNGFFTIRVATELSAPDPLASVTVEVYAYTDETFTYMNPRPTPPELILESGVKELVPTAGGDVTGVYGGERITSLRTLVQRPAPWTLCYPQLFAPTAGTVNRIFPFEVSWFPYTPTETDTTAFNPFMIYKILLPAEQSSYPKFNHPIKAFSRMYLGWRGSWRYKVVVIPNQFNGRAEDSSDTLQWFVSHAFVGHASQASLGQDVSPTPLSTTGGQAWNFLGGRHGSTGWNYQDVVSLGAGMEFSLPHYYPRRFNLTRVFPNGNYEDSGDDKDPGANLIFYLNTASGGGGSAANTRPVAIIYASAGSDFSYQRFRCVPRITYP